MTTDFYRKFLRIRAVCAAHGITLRGPYWRRYHDITFEFEKDGFTRYLGMASGTREVAMINAILKVISNICMEPFYDALSKEDHKHAQ